MQQLLGHQSADTAVVSTRDVPRDLPAALDDAGIL